MPLIWTIFLSDIDVLGNILNGMTEKRSKAKVIEKLMGLGLVQDRKELYKKRGKGGARRRRGRHGNSDDDSDDEEDGPQGNGVRTNQ